MTHFLLHPIHSIPFDPLQDLQSWRIHFLPEFGSKERRKKKTLRHISRFYKLYLAEWFISRGRPKCWIKNTLDSAKRTLLTDPQLEFRFRRLLCRKLFSQKKKWTNLRPLKVEMNTGIEVGSYRSVWPIRTNEEKQSNQPAVGSFCIWLAVRK